jgi:hypothetical protein
MKKKIFPVIIEDLSEAEQAGYSITLPELHGSIVMGANYDELAKGLEMTYSDEQMECPEALLQSIKTYIEEIENGKYSRTCICRQ